MTAKEFEFLATGVSAGAAAAVLVHYFPERRRWMGLVLAIAAGAALAYRQLADLPDWPVHSFERDPLYFYAPSIAGMLGVYATARLLARRKHLVWLTVVLGPLSYFLSSALMFVLMLFACCA